MSVDLSVKRARIGTHNGTFHCDEVLACYMLKTLPQYKDSEIVRTRDAEVLKSCDIVVDVGGVYDPSNHRYDHHQRGFDGTMSTLCPGKPWVTKLSSAGLVYLHFGRKILAEVLKCKEFDAIVDKLYDKMYENFIEEIDGIDNGIPISEDKPKYLITTNLSARVGHLNPWWNDEHPDIEDRFHKALDLVGHEFLDRVNFYAKAWWPAREFVKDSVENRFETDVSGEIMLLSRGGYPWKDHLFTLEEELEINPSIKFVIFEDTNHTWRVQAVPIYHNSFVLRVPLVPEWQGLRDEEASKAAGIPGTIFVHGTGFIGGNQTQDGALEMARKSLKLHNEKNA
ncbi:UPF0160 protein myg1, mitochondrial, variant 2 [Chamberlinius hualienensis]